MKQNEYFDRFLQYIVSNMVAAVCYFLLAAILGGTGAQIGETASQFIVAAATAIPFALTVFVSTLRDKALRRGDLRGYFAGTGRGDLILYALWSLCGAIVAIAGGAAGITVYIFLAQALPAAALTTACGTAVGLPLSVAVSVALYTLARTTAIMAKKS